MKNAKLQNFLKHYLKANAIVIFYPEICELISFNNELFFKRYQHFLEKKNYEVLSNHLKALLSSKSDVKVYLNFMIKQINDTLSEYYEKDGYLLHQRLYIKDKSENAIQFEALSPDVKSKISRFVSLQKSSLMCFLSKLDLSETQLPYSGLKWTASKTDFIELTNALFEGGFIKSENGNLTKKDFVESMSKIFQLESGPWEIKLNKAMLRENPAKFIDRLKDIISEYCAKFININNG